MRNKPFLHINNEPTQVSPKIKALFLNIFCFKERRVGRNDHWKPVMHVYVILNLAYLCIQIRIHTDTHTSTYVSLSICGIFDISLSACYSKASRQKHLPRIWGEASSSWINTCLAPGGISNILRYPLHV